MEIVRHMRKLLRLPRRPQAPLDHYHRRNNPTDHAGGFGRVLMVALVRAACQGVPMSGLKFRARGPVVRPLCRRVVSVALQLVQYAAWACRRVVATRAL